MATQLIMKQKINLQYQEGEDEIEWACPTKL